MPIMTATRSTVSPSLRLGDVLRENLAFRFWDGEIFEPFVEGSDCQSRWHMVGKPRIDGGRTNQKAWRVEWWWWRCWACGVVHQGPLNGCAGRTGCRWGRSRRCGCVARVFPCALTNFSQLISEWMCNTAREIEAATQPLWQWLPQLLSHSATLPEWLPQPLSHSARVAAATTQPFSHSARVAAAATQPLSHSGRAARSHSATLAERLAATHWVSAPATLAERLSFTFKSCLEIKRLYQLGMYDCYVEQQSYCSLSGSFCYLYICLKKYSTSFIAIDLSFSLASFKVGFWKPNPALSISKYMVSSYWFLSCLLILILHKAVAEVSKIGNL